jgi:hypothetical protein
MHGAPAFRPAQGAVSVATHQGCSSPRGQHQREPRSLAPPPPGPGPDRRHPPSVTTRVPRAGIPRGCRAGRPRRGGGARRIGAAVTLRGVPAPVSRAVPGRLVSVSADAKRLRTLPAEDIKPEASRELGSKATPATEAPAGPSSAGSAASPTARRLRRPGRRRATSPFTARPWAAPPKDVTRPAPRGATSGGAPVVDPLDGRLLTPAPDVGGPRLSEKLAPGARSSTRRARVVRDGRLTARHARPRGAESVGARSVRGSRPRRPPPARCERERERHRERNRRTSAPAWAGLSSVSRARSRCDRAMLDTSRANAHPAPRCDGRCSSSSTRRPVGGQGSRAGRRRRPPIVLGDVLDDVHHLQAQPKLRRGPTAPPGWSGRPGSASRTARSELPDGAGHDVACTARDRRHSPRAAAARNAGAHARTPIPLDFTGEFVRGIGGPLGRRGRANGTKTAPRAERRGLHRYVGVRARAAVLALSLKRAAAASAPLPARPPHQRLRRVIERRRSGGGRAPSWSRPCRRCDRAGTPSAPPRAARRQRLGWTRRRCATPRQHRPGEVGVGARCCRTCSVMPTSNEPAAGAGPRDPRRPDVAPSTPSPGLPPEPARNEPRRGAPPRGGPAPDAVPGSYRDHRSAAPPAGARHTVSRTRLVTRSPPATLDGRCPPASFTVPDGRGPAAADGAACC